MMTTHNAVTRLGALCMTCITAGAWAQSDIYLSGLYFNQGNNFTNTTLVGNRATMVRARIGVTGTTSPVATVDAILRVFVGGIEISASPFFSVNGPISAPVSPLLTTQDHTLNFIVVVPDSPSVQFVVEVDPGNRVVESDETNNVSSPFNRTFSCRKIVDLAYVSVNYTPGGGVPSATYTAPGIGDCFLRGIYPVGEWNYHRVPFAPLLWSSNINTSNNGLLAELSDIRQIDMTAAGFARPDFIYGWLPGNPFSGNGQANGIPGDAAFGNTENARFQRTMAHEVGHLWGLVHTSNTAGQVGIDVEHHLRNPLNLAQLHGTSQSDVMVAGLLTNQAWVDQSTMNQCLTDSRSQCAAAFTDGEGQQGEPVFRIAGEFDHTTGMITLAPLHSFERGFASAFDPSGDLDVFALDAKGRTLASVRWRSGTTRDLCCSHHPIDTPILADRTPIYVTIPTGQWGEARLSSIELREVSTGLVIASQHASLSHPEVDVTSARLVVGLPTTSPIGTAAPEACLEVTWTASDADSDALRTTIEYSPDQGDRWIPIAFDQGASGVIRVPLTEIPAARFGQSTIRARVQDGFHVGEGLLQVSMSMIGNPPDIHLLAPNGSDVFPQHAGILLHASGWDLEDEYLPNNAFVWTSSIDGVISSSRQEVVKDLSPGVHTLTLSGTDTEGLSASAQIVITVTAREVIRGDLTEDAIVDGADLAALLALWGTMSSRGDLDGNGIVDGGDLGILLAVW